MSPVIVECSGDSAGISTADVPWNTLPGKLWVRCFGYLSWLDRLRLLSVCQDWNHILEAQETWPGVTRLNCSELKDRVGCRCHDFRLTCPDTEEIQKRLDRMGNQLGSFTLTINLDQAGGHLASTLVTYLNSAEPSTLARISARKLVALDISKFGEDLGKRISLRNLHTLSHVNESFNGIDCRDQSINAEITSFMTEIRMSVIETWTKIGQFNALKHLFLNMFFTFNDIDKVGDLARSLPSLESLFIRVFEFSGEKFMSLMRQCPTSLKDVVVQSYGPKSYLTDVEFDVLVKKHPHLQHLVFINVKVLHSQLGDIIRGLKDSALSVAFVERAGEYDYSKRIVLSPLIWIDSISFDPNRYMIHLWHTMSCCPFFCSEQEGEFGEIRAAGFTNISCS